MGFPTISVHISRALRALVDLGPHANVASIGKMMHANRVALFRPTYIYGLWENRLTNKSQSFDFEIN